MRAFRERLKEAAAYAKVEYSQQAIATSLGIKRRQTVDRWMADGKPSAKMIFKIAQKWGVSAAWLAEESGEMVPKVLEPPSAVRGIPTHKQRKIFIPPDLYEKLFVACRTFLNNDREGQEEMLNAVKAIGDGRTKGRAKQRP